MSEEQLTPDEEKAVAEVAKAVAGELAEGKSKDRIVRDLVKAGWEVGPATSFVEAIEESMEEARQTPDGRRAMAAAYARHMVYGALWATGGTVATVWTYAAAASGGTYFVAWGAILWGVIDFFRGLGGWLKYRD